MIRLLLTALLMAGVAWPQDPPAVKFRSSTDAVRVDVQAWQGNRTLTGLTAADFELRDSGVVQQIQTIDTEDIPLTLLLALDTSGSVEGPMLANLKAAARSAVGALAANDRAALLTFTHQVSRQAAPTPDRAAIHQAIEQIGAKGSTSMFDAVFAGIALREQTEERVILLVFTDGLDTSSWLESNQVIDAALRSDVVVYSVSISSLFVVTDPKDSGAVIRRKIILKRWFDAHPDLFPQGFLNELTARTGGEAFYVRDGGELVTAFAGIVAEFRSRYLLSYSPRNVPAGGWHPIEVKLKNHRGSIRARRGYWR